MDDEERAQKLMQLVEQNRAGDTFDEALDWLLAMRFARTGVRGSGARWWKLGHPLPP